MGVPDGVTAMSTNPVTVAPFTSVTDTVTRNVVAAVTRGGANVTDVPDPVSVPPVACQVYVSGSPSLSFAATAIDVVCRSVIEDGVAAGPETICGAALPPFAGVANSSNSASPVVPPRATLISNRAHVTTREGNVITSPVPRLGSVPTGTVLPSLKRSVPLTI